MIIKVQARQTGKTYDIAKQMKKYKNSVVIVPTMNMRQIFIKTYKIDEKRVFTFVQAIRDGATKGFKKVYIDELGCGLGMILDNIVYATHTDF